MLGYFNYDRFFMTTIYHNPRCSTSRAALERLHQHGLQPTVIEYLKQPYTPELLKDLMDRAGLSASELIRQKEALYTELGLDQPGRTEQDLIDAMVAHPVLVNRPIVVTGKGVRLCRPLDRINDIL